MFKQYSAVIASLFLHRCLFRPPL